MKIRITQCTVARYWYADRIGEEFALVNETKHEVRETSERANTCCVVIADNKEAVVAVADCERV